MRAHWIRVAGWLLIGWIIVGPGAVAEAHKGAGEGPPDAATWVRQALAFLGLKPPNLEEAVERLEGALKARDPRGVDLALVREAMEALKARDTEGASEALNRALLPPPPPAPSPAPAAPSAALEPHHADEDASAHHLPGAPLKALEPRFSGSAHEYALLGFGAALIVAGLMAARVTGRRRRGTGQ